MFFRKHKETLSLLVLAVIFFYLYLFLYLNPSILSLPPVLLEGSPALSPPAGGGVRGGWEPAFLILNQPDEAVNYFFIRELVLNNRFRFPEPLSAATASQVHPRSATVINGAIVPIGFPGMIVIFSFLLKCLLLVAGENFFNLLAVSLTPLLAVATPFFFYGFLRRIFEKNIAWLSSVFLFFLPAWWYYASRPFQHNTLFVFLIAALLYCYGVIRERSFLCHSREACPRPRSGSGNPANTDNWIPACAGMTGVGLPFLLGILFGLAIYVRPVEIVWLALLGLVLLIASRRAWSFREYLGLSLGLFLAAILFFATQTAFFGHPLASGYARPQIDGSAGLVVSGPQDIPLLKALTLPFGFHPRAILHNLRAYFIDLFGLWTIIFLAGLLILITQVFRQRFSKNNIQSASWRTIFNIQYLLFFLLFTFYFLLFYGSWLFYDNLVREPSIGTSHVRYFLPIYVFGLPLVASFIVWLWQRSRVLKIGTAVLVSVLFLSSLAQVFAPLEGLSSVKKTIQNYQVWQKEVYSRTESEAVVVTRYADKYLFPGRKIIPGWQEPEQIQAIGNLAKEGFPVYFYDLKLDEKSLTDLKEKLAEVGATLSAPLADWENLELRRIPLSPPHEGGD